MPPSRSAPRNPPTPSPASAASASLALLIALGTIWALLGCLPPECSADAPDWVISTPTTLEDTLRDLRANLIIESGGELRLINSTLLMNCSKDGEFELTVKAGGRLMMERANLTAGPGGWKYIFRSRGDLDLQDSDISGTVGGFESGGLFITGGQATISRCRFRDHQWYAVVANGTSPAITGCTIEYCKAGIRVDNGGAPSITGNTIRNCDKEGIIVLRSSPTIRNNRITGCWRGIGLFQSSPTMEGNDITLCGSVGVDCSDGSDAHLTQNNITRCWDGGVTVLASSPTLEGNLISGNGVGINLSFSKPRMVRNTISGSRTWGILARSGAPVLDGNTWTDGDLGPNAQGDLAVQWRLNLRVEDAKHGLVENADVTVKDIHGTVLFKGKTQGDGTVGQLYLQQYHQDASGRTDDTPHRIAVSGRGLSTSKEIRCDKDQAFTVTLGETSKPFIMGFEAPLLLASLALASAFLFARKRT